MEAGYRRLSATGRVPFAWQAQDLNRDGACGNALDADAERGRRLVEHAAQAFVELVGEADRFPLASLSSPPLPGRPRRRRGRAGG